MMSRVVRHLREGFRNVLRNGWMTFASMSAVVVTLAVLGISLVLALNAQQASKYVTNQLVFHAYLKPDASDATGEHVAKEIEQLPNVENVQVIGKEQGIKQLEQDVGPQYSNVIAGLKKNPLPVQIVVKASNPRDTVQIADEVQVMPEVANVQTGQKYIGRLFQTLDVIRDVGLVFVIALLVTSMFLISNTIKMTIFSRRREIEIMKLVGATNWFIRWPFVIEGMLIGVFGAVIPLVLLGYGYNLVYKYLHGTFVGMAFSLAPSGPLLTKLSIVLLGIGIFIGVWGGSMSVRKFLRI